MLQSAWKYSVYADNRKLDIKFMYKDYAPLPCIEPTEEEFLEVIGKYLEFNRKKGEMESDI